MIIAEYTGAACPEYKPPADVYCVRCGQLQSDHPQQGETAQ